MQREVIKWLQTLDLSCPVKNPRRDLASGVAVAEIISRYADVLPMHAVSTGVSRNNRQHNWQQVLAALHRLHCDTVTTALVEATLRLQPNAAMTLLEHLYEFFTHRALPARTLLVADGVPVTASRALDDNNNNVTSDPAVDCVQTVLRVTGTLREGHDPDDVATAQAVLALTRNDELARGGAGAGRVPGYAVPTAATLLHAANHDRHDVALGKDYYVDDESRARAENGRIAQEHDAVRRAAAGQQQDAVKTRSLTAMLRGPHATPPRAKRVGSLARSVRASTVARSVAESEARTVAGKATSLASNAVGSCAPGLVPKLKVNVMRAELLQALQGTDAAAHLDARAGQKSVEFFAACGHSLRRACSSLLKDVLAAHHELYNVLEWCGEHSEGNALQDLLTAVVAHRDALQPTTLRACGVALEQNVDGIAAAVTARIEEYAYLLHAFSYVFGADAARVPLLHVSDLAQGGPDDAVVDESGPRARAVWYDRRASHVAWGVVLLDKVAAAVRRGDAAVSERVLRRYVLPAAQVTLSTGGAAMVEAVGRVVVSHVCVFATPPSGGNDGIDAWLAQHTTQAQSLVALLDHVATSHTGTEENTLSAARVRQGGATARADLLRYHVLRHYTHRLRMSGPSTALLTRVWRTVLTPLVTCAFDTASRCLSSEQSEVRGVGVGLVTLLVRWGWEGAVVERLRSRGRTLRAWAVDTVGGGIGAVVAATWELRVWVLELLTLLLRRLVQRDDSDVDVDMMAETETATVWALESFLRGAPTPQRQLALSIVAGRLLPDFAPQLASCWLRAALQSPLLPSHPHATRHVDSPPPARLRRATLAALDELEDTATSAAAVTTLVEGDGCAAPHTPCDRDAVRVLLGRVEPAYVVAPLHQSWNTCGVVQLVLQRKSSLSVVEVLTVVAAALLGPQPVCVQAAQLLHDAHLTLSHHPCTAFATHDGVDDAVTLYGLLLHDAVGEVQGHVNDSQEGRAVLERELAACQAQSPAQVTQAFWRSVLRHVLPLLRSSLADTPCTAASSSSGTPNATPDAARALAELVLSCLYHRHIPHDATDVSVPDMLECATRWVDASAPLSST